MTWPLRQGSLLWSVMYAPQTQKLLRVNNAYYSLSLPQFRFLKPTKCMWLHQAFPNCPANPWPWDVVNKCHGTECSSELGHCPWIDWASWTVVGLWFVYEYHRELALCCFQDTRKPPRIFLKLLHMAVQHVSGHCPSWAVSFRKLCLVIYAPGGGGGGCCFLPFPIRVV